MVESVPSVAYVENMINSNDGAPLHLFDAERIEQSHIKDMLHYLIDAFGQEMKALTNQLEAYTSGENEVINELIKMMQSFEITKSHFMLLLELIMSKGDDDIANIKEKFPQIKAKYEHVKNIDDLSIVPVKYGLMFIYNKILSILKRVVSESFKENFAGDVELVTAELHVERIRIAAHRANMCNNHFNTVATLPKGDIFRYEKSSELWQDLQRNVEFKRFNTYDEVMSSFRIVHFTILLGFATMNNRAKKKPSSTIEKYYNLFKDTIYYGIDHDAMETDAQHYLINPPLEEAFKVWNIPENFFVSRALQARLPFIGHDSQIFVPKLFPPITKELVMREFANGTLNKICPVSPTEIGTPNLSGNRSDIVDELHVEDENKIPVRIIASEPLDLKGTKKSLIGGVLQSAIDVVKGSHAYSDEAIVIHVHGGGFVSLSSSSHRSYLLKWAKNLKLIHFSIDYRLAPKVHYPDTLDDVWQAYMWIMNFAESTLGIKKRKVILIGDSAGANLILALTLWIIRAGLKVPDGLVLLYPSLSLDLDSFSPSYFLSIDDRLLPYTLMRLVNKAYIGEGIDPTKDPFVTPLVASDELLAKLPPVRIVSGSNDPLHDENWRLLYRLKKLRKEVKFVVHENLAHAYLSNQDLKRYDMYCDEACDLIREIIALGPQ